MYELIQTLRRKDLDLAKRVLLAQVDSSERGRLDIVKFLKSQIK